MTASAKPRTAEQVREYLLAHPDYFLQQPDLLLQLNFPHETGGAVSLIERQVERLRAELNEARRQLHQLSDNAEANQQLLQRFAELLTSLLKANNATELLERFVERLVGDFHLEGIALYLPASCAAPPGNTFRTLTEEQLGRLGAHMLNLHTYVGRAPAELAELLDLGDSRPVSLALLRFSLNSEEALFCMASDDASRFQSGMATDFLEILVRALATLLERHL